VAFHIAWVWKMLWYLFHEWIDFFFKKGFMVTWIGYGLSVTFLNWVAQFEDML
jgi:hypothetical protein